MEDWNDARAFTADLGRLKARCPAGFAQVQARILSLLADNRLQAGPGAVPGPRQEDAEDPREQGARPLN